MALADYSGRLVKQDLLFLNPCWDSFIELHAFCRSIPWAWSKKGCTLTHVNHQLATCQCESEGTFAVLSDLYDVNVSSSHGIVITWYCYHMVLLSHGIVITWYCYHMVLLSHGIVITWYCYHMVLLSIWYCYQYGIKSYDITRHQHEYIISHFVDSYIIRYMT